MKITLTLLVPDEQDVDLTHPMGITAEAHDRLTDALISSDFEIADGPEQVIES